MINDPGVSRRLLLLGQRTTSKLFLGERASALLHGSFVASVSLALAVDIAADFGSAL
jgi:hypothetical protein